MIKKSAAVIALFMLASLAVTGCIVRIVTNQTHQAEGALNDTLKAGDFSLGLRNLTLNKTADGNQTEVSVIVNIRNTGGVSSAKPASL
jgi:hypothetical protein